MNIKQKLILAFAVIASLPVILVAVLIILNVHEVLHRADHDRVVSRHWEGLTPRNQTVGGGLSRHGQCAHLAVAIHQWSGVLLGHDEVLKLWEGACPR